MINQDVFLKENEEVLATFMGAVVASGSSAIEKLAMLLIRISMFLTGLRVTIDIVVTNTRYIQETKTKVLWIFHKSSATRVVPTHFIEEYGYETTRSWFIFNNEAVSLTTSGLGTQQITPKNKKQDIAHFLRTVDALVNQAN